MSGSPTSRFRIAPAPEGLRVVQDFLNTRAIDAKGFPDLLSDATAAATMAAMVAGPKQAITDVDAESLRALRTDVESIVAGGAPRVHSVDAVIGPDISGTVSLTPAGEGWAYYASAIWAEVLVAQRTDVWRRLKQCKNPGCRSAFYDKSRNNSGVWHDVKTCGNAANLRASRARRRVE